MAKEMMIVFVYDTLRCQSEWDDPAEAVLYFHPGWVSDAQRHALSGQIVGAAHCVASILSQPTAVTLQSGKFLIRQYGRYLLAVGSDRNIPDWVLKNRTDLLTSMIKVYHGDLATIAAQFPGDNNTRFSEKLYQMFETYLPILQFGCHIFQRVPMFNLPKSATSIHMEAMQVLEYCQRMKGMLGGVILYNNKIVASQLSPKLTSHLAVVDPYRIKSPAEQCPTQAPLPLGAQLLLVYISKKDYKKLKNEATKMQLLAGGSEEIVEQFKKNVDLAKSSKEFMPSGMKRDKSLLFTAVPEEDSNLISPPFAYSEKSIASEVEKAKVNMPDVVPFTSKPRPRPNKLSLSFKNCVQSSLDEEVTEKQEPERKFTGQTSVCSTPMLEYKRLHGNVLSICQNPESSIINRVLNAEPGASQPDVLKTNDGNSDGKHLVNKNTYREVDDVITNYVSKPEISRKLGSVNDIQDTLKRFSQRASKKLKQIRDGVTRDSSSPSPDMSKSTEYDKNSYMTITDPLYPVFRNDGMPISKSLYNAYLEQHYRNMNEEDIAENMFSFNTRVAEQEKTLEGFDSDMMSSPKQTPKKVAVAKAEPKPDHSRRKSLSLPLKPLNDNPDDPQSNEGLHSKKRSAGVQLTPLMEKLSYLAFSEKSSGYSSRVMTPLDLKDFPTPGLERNTNISDSRSRRAAASSDSESEDELGALPDHSTSCVRRALFVSGLQNMALMVLMEESAADDAQAIHTLWETSLNNLGPIEQKCMEPFPTMSESSEYSYLTLDPDWGTVAKGGPWASLDIATMGLIHHEFAEDDSVSEIILRTEESVVLGTTCGGAEVYYQENGAKQPGLPTPADAMSTVQLKAKRRLHRDHSVVIL